MGHIPEHATKVFNGIIFDVYQYEQELYDGSIATFERLTRPYTLQCIPIVGDKILITRDAQPDRAAAYSFPGGRHEQGEDYRAGAIRELEEETGYTSDNLELYKVYSPLNKIDWDIYIYIAHNATKVTEPCLDPGEQIDTFLVTFEEFIDIVANETFIETEFALDILRMERAGTLDQFKTQLFKNTKDA